MYKKVIFTMSMLLAGLFITPNLQAQEGFIGEIRMFAGNFAPRGWQLCQGQVLAISNNQSLFSILGVTYGGDGRTTFMLPDLRGRVPVGTGAGTGLTDQRLGQRSGTETTTLIQANLPAHQHGIAAYDINSDEDNHEFQHGSKSLISVGNEGKTIIPSNANGANIPVSNMQPSLSINFIICTVGLYPSRN